MRLRACSLAPVDYASSCSESGRKQRKNRRERADLASILHPSVPFLSQPMSRQRLPSLALQFLSFRRPMLSQHRRAFSNTVLALDLVVVGTAIALAADRAFARPLVLLLEVGAAWVVWIGLATRTGLYHSRRTTGLPSEIWLLTQLALLSAGAALVAHTAAGQTVPLRLSWLLGISLGGTAGLRLYVRP